MCSNGTQRAPFTSDSAWLRSAIGCATAAMRRHCAALRGKIDKNRPITGSRLCRDCGLLRGQFQNLITQQVTPEDQRMLDVYSWPTPNGHKVQIALEELGLEYRLI